MVGEREETLLGEQIYTKYNKINNNSENFRRENCCWEEEALPPGPL